MYGSKLQTYPRITTLLTTYDDDIKKIASVFETEDVATFVNNTKTSTPYWLVRKCIIIVAFFGGLRHTEAITLELEKITNTADGILFTHSRSKQRSDKKETKFLVPRIGDINYAAVIVNICHKAGFRTVYMSPFLNRDSGHLHSL